MGRFYFYSSTSFLVFLSDLDVFEKFIHTHSCVLHFYLYELVLKAWPHALLSQE